MVIGSTGSLGQSVLAVARAFSDRLQVVGLAAGSNVELLARQAAEFQAKMVSYAQGHWGADFPSVRGLRFLTPREMVAAPEVDVVVVASVGKSGLAPAWAALEAGKTVLLGNNEVWLMAGSLLVSHAQTHRGRLLPLDDEPSAVWQCLLGEAGPVRRVYLTSTWGTIRSRQLRQHGPVLPERVVEERSSRRMGKKRAIDATTLVNKATQVAQVHYICGVPVERIQVVYHPESVVRALVEFADGSLKALLAQPDIRLPIQVALSLPQRWPTETVPPLDLLALSKLTFETLEEERFPCYRLAVAAVKGGGTYPAVLSAANERAIDLFLSQQIGFTEMPAIMSRTLDAHRPVSQPTFEDILAADQWARSFAGSQVPE